MKHAPVFSAALLFAVVWLFAPPPAFSQDPPSQDAPSQEAPSQDATPTPAPAGSQPKPAGREYQPFGDDQEGPPDATAFTPDTTPLTGVFVPGIGSPEIQHSYWVPGLQYGNFIRSSGALQPSVPDWNSTSYIAGNLSLLENWSRSQLGVNYSGGATFSTDKSQGNSYYHQLSFSQSFNWQRWQLAFVDQFSYLPESQFGFGTASSFAIPGVGGSLGLSLPGLQNNYQPNQSVFASIGPRYSNSTTAQVAYQLSARGSLSFSASYGFLRFEDPGNFNSNDAIFGVGYNYALSKKDTIGILYRFSDYQYDNNPQAIKDQVVQLAYGRKVTGKLALQLLAGPEYTGFRVPLLSGATNNISLAAGANLTYSLPRTSLPVEYNYGVTGGSGVLVGSNTNQVQGSINRRLTRVWHGGISGGYARNTTLGGANVLRVSPSFDSWFAGAGLDRPLGRTSTVNLGYTAFFQNVGGMGCTAQVCVDYLQEQVSVSLQWHTRPFVLR
jgi:hypothetical protein